MAMRGSSFGFMGRFGRSADLRSLDAAMRAADLHPALVPEGVKLALVNLVKERFQDEPPESAYAGAAVIFAYCALGPEGFEQANGPDALAAISARLDTALLGDGLDPDIVLLAQHARMLQPAVVARHGIDIESA